jgi:hypothetical protein
MLSVFVLFCSTNWSRPRFPLHLYLEGAAGVEVDIALREGDGNARMVQITERALSSRFTTVVIEHTSKVFATVIWRRDASPKRIIRSKCLLNAPVYFVSRPMIR